MNAESQEVFADAVLRCLKKPSTWSKLHVIKEAARLGISKNKHQGGIFGLFADAEETLDGLIYGDPGIWAQLLAETTRDDYFEFFKDLSPFAGSLIIIVECRGGEAVSYSGNTTGFNNSAVISERAKKAIQSEGWEMTLYDRFMVAFSVLDLQPTNVYWAGSCNPSVHGPLCNRHPPLAVRRL